MIATQSQTARGVHTQSTDVIIAYNGQVIDDDTRI